MTQEQTPSERSILRRVSPKAWIALVLGSILILYGMYRFGRYYEATWWDWMDLLLVPAALAVFGLWFNRRQNKRENERERHDADRERHDADRERKQREHDAMVNALQGKKESVAYVAYQVRRHGLKQLKGLPDELDRSELIAPLCLAAIYEGSDRTRALVLSALERCKQDGYYKDIEHTLSEIQDTFDNYNKLLKEQARDLELGKLNPEIGKHRIMLQILRRFLGFESASPQANAPKVSRKE